METGCTPTEGGGPRAAQAGRVGRGVGEAAPVPVRVAMIATLAEQITAAAAAGDVEAARVAHEALGKLLPGLGQGAAVIDFASVRA